MRASDFATEPCVQVYTEDGPVYRNTAKQSETEWDGIVHSFVDAPSHIEVKIVSEVELEAARRELVQKGVIRQEKIEKKTYSAAVRSTLKHSVLSAAAHTLRDMHARIEEREAEEDRNRMLIAHFAHREHIKRKDNTLCVHIHNKMYMPISKIEQGKCASYIVCTLVQDGVVHKGYITEHAIAPFLRDDKEKLQSAIILHRDRAENSTILQEYSIEDVSAHIERVHDKPQVQSPCAAFVICALKCGYTFAQTAKMMEYKKN